MLAVRRGIEDNVDGDLVARVDVNGFPYHAVCLWRYEGLAKGVGPQGVIEHLGSTGETRIQGRN